MFYVYVYRDPRPTKAQQVVYVGKGAGDRAWAHWRKPVHLNKAFGAFLALLRREKLEPIIEIIRTLEDEAEAFAEEIRLIEFYGRRDIKTGSLFNLTEGGEGLCGAIRTEEWRKNISDALLTPEHVSRQRIAKLRYWADPVVRERMTAAIRVALKSPEVKARRKAAVDVYKDTPEFRQTMHDASTKMWQDPEYAAKVKAAYLEAHKPPEVIAAKSRATTLGWEDAETRAKRTAGIRASRTPELRAQLSKSCSALWDGETRKRQSEKMKATLANPEMKAQRAAAMKARWEDPVKRAAMLASRMKK